MNALTAAGLGLDYQTVRLERTTEDWLVAGDFRDLLRCSSEAREGYEAEKLSLAETHPHDCEAYTDDRTKVVRELLGAWE